MRHAYNIPFNYIGVFNVSVNAYFNKTLKLKLTPIKIYKHCSLLLLLLLYYFIK